MNRLLLLSLFVLTALSTYGQAPPQAVCYQAVATDAEGRELVNDTISIRATILKGDINGNIVWQETHKAETDAFGLFTFNIGEGVNVGGLPLFEDIEWGMDVYFLRIEMDVSGGTTYILMGVNQILSVPYALYAGEAARADFAQNANSAIYADTAIFANQAQNAIYADTAVFANQAQNAFYADTSIYASQAQNAFFADTSIYSSTSQTSIYADSSLYADYSEVSNFSDTTNFSFIANNANFSDTTNFSYTAGNAIYSDTTIYAISADTALYSQISMTSIISLNDMDSDSTNELQSLTYDGAGNLSLTNAPGGGSPVFINVNDADSSATNEIQTMDFDGNTLTLSDPSGGTSTVEFNNHIFGAPGASYDFPQGIFGEAMVLSMGTFNVPVGKIFYITSSEDELLIFHPDIGAQVWHPTTPNMPVLKENTTVTNCLCTGFLFDEVNYLEPVIIQLSDPADEFVIPAGKNLFIKSGMINEASGLINIDGHDMEFLRPNLTRGTRIIVLKEGTTIKKPIGGGFLSNFILTGYLLDNSIP